MKRDNKELSEKWEAEVQVVIDKTHEGILRLSLNDEQLLDRLKKRLGESVGGDKALILYGSETGNAEMMAEVLAEELLRRGIKSNLSTMNDYEFDDLSSETMVYNVISTCGQGEYPGNCKNFMKAISDNNLPADWLKNVQFSVFGMGDSSYAHFNKAGLDLDHHLSRLGATSVQALGNADDKDEEG